jgi:hypothetical protein
VNPGHPAIDALAPVSGKIWGGAETFRLRNKEEEMPTLMKTFTFYEPCQALIISAPMKDARPLWSFVQS